MQRQESKFSKFTRSNYFQELQVIVERAIDSRTIEWTFELISISLVC